MNKYLIIFTSLFVITVSSFTFAKPPGQQAAAVPAPQVFSIGLDYVHSEIVVKGNSLDPDSVSATLAGVALTLNTPASDTELRFPFSADLTAVVNQLGNYVFELNNGGGSFSSSIFIPFALTYIPPSSGPCPCQGEWDLYGGLASPAGFQGQAPYCAQDTGDFVTVQFWDTSVGNYWVLWTDWDGIGGSCALYIDAPTRDLTSEAEFAACADYLRLSYIEVYPGTGTDCLF